MLTLGRFDGRKSVLITFRKHDQFLTADLGKAFFAALIFHIALFAIFTIRTKSIPYDSLHRPVRVTADIYNNSQSIESRLPTRMTTGGILSTIIVPPESSAPAEPHMTITPFDMRNRYTREEPHIEDLFQQVERVSERPSHENQDRYHPTNNDNSHLTISISGPLASYPLINDERPNLSLSSRHSGAKNIYALSYSVLVEGKSGKIFWIDNGNEQENHTLDRKARTILETLVFSFHDAIIEGTVEICFSTNQ